MGRWDATNKYSNLKFWCKTIIQRPITLNRSSNKDFEMNAIWKLMSVIGIFSFGLAIIFLFIWFVKTKNLLNFWGILIASLGVGLGFCVVTMLGTYLDEKSQSWDLIKRIAISGEVFIWSFVGSVIAILLALKILQLRKLN